MAEPDARRPSVVVRPMRAGDIDGGLRLCRAAGWNQVARDWQQLLALTPGGALVAEMDGRLVGTLTTTRYEARLAWIGMVLVDPPARGRGIGTRLLDEGLALLRDLPQSGLDATPAGYPLYLSRGFVEQRRLQRLQATAPPDPGAPSGVRPMQGADLAAVSALDRPAFGADRAAMLRWMWEGAPEYAWVALAGGRPAGFVLGRHGHTFEHLGPVVAADAGMARDLVAACLRGGLTRAVVLDVPVDAAGWESSLDAFGFRVQRPLIRMATGSARLPGDSSQFAILGPEFG